MKLNLLRNSPDTMSGYINIDAFGGDDPNKKQGDVTNLDTIVCDAEAEEIIARDVIDFLPPIVVNRVIDHWIKKLSHGGKLVIGGIDMYDVCKAVASYALPPTDASIMLHGEQEPTKGWNIRKSTANMSDVVQLLKAKGLNIISKRCANYRFSVVAERP